MHHPLECKSDITANKCQINNVITVDTSFKEHREQRNGRSASRFVSNKRQASQLELKKTPLGSQQHIQMSRQKRQASQLELKKNPLGSQRHIQQSRQKRQSPQLGLKNKEDGEIHSSHRESNPLFKMRKKKMTQEEQDKLENEIKKSQRRFVFFHTIAENIFFVGTVAFMIALNSITLGVYTNLNTTNEILETFFIIFFTVEVIIKLLAYKTAVFWSSFWNIFDFILAVVCIADLVAQSFGDAEGFSVARIFRMARIARLLKLMRVFKPLQDLILGLRNSFVRILWVTLMLSVIIYATSIFLVIYVGHESELWKEAGTERLISAWFGTVELSFLTLFQIMTLESWSMGIVRPIMEVKPEASIIFLLFICLTTFAFLNIITGIVVDSTMKACEEGLTKLKQRQQVLPILNRALESMDTDKNGELSLQELNEALGNEKVRKYIRFLGVHPEDVPRLFDTFDSDRSGSVDYHEFIDEFLTLTDSAKKKDIALLRANLQHLKTAINDHVDKLQERKEQYFASGKNRTKLINAKNVNEKNNSVTNILKSRGIICHNPIQEMQVNHGYDTEPRISIENNTSEYDEKLESKEVRKKKKESVFKDWEWREEVDKRLSEYEMRLKSIDETLKTKTPNVLAKLQLVLNRHHNMNEILAKQRKKQKILREAVMSP